MDEKIKPLGANVLVKIIPVKKMTASGLHLPDTARIQKVVTECDVIAVGSDCSRIKDGAEHQGATVFVPTDMLYDSTRGWKLNEELFIVHEDCLIAYQEEYQEE